MRRIGLIGIAIALLAAGCGGGSERSQRPEEVVIWKRGVPVGLAQRGAPPKRLIVKDIKTGSGAVLRKGRTATLRYKSFDYATGQRYEDWWGDPFVTGFGHGESLAAWETGLAGMRVGGRRVLIVPAKQAYANVPVLYILELVKVS